jgi:hypothetical protein
VAGRDRPQLRIGQWSGETIPGSVDAGGPVHGFRWVDGDHYLFVARYDWEQGAEGDRLDLILGEIGGSSAVLVIAADDIPYHSFHTAVAPAESLWTDGSIPSTGALATTDVSSWQGNGRNRASSETNTSNSWSSKS